MFKWKVNYKGKSDFKILHASHAWVLNSWEGNFQDLITKQDLSPKPLGSQAWSRRDRWWRRSWAEDSTCSAGSTWTPWKVVKCNTKTRWPPYVEGVLRSQVEHPAQVDVVQLGLVRVHLNSVIIFSLSLEINFRQDKVNTADSAFIFLIILLISQNKWSGWSGRKKWSFLVWSLLER